MRANGFKVILILAIIALLWALVIAPNRSVTVDENIQSASMGEDIRSALLSAGYSNTQVEIKGDVVTLSGETVSEKRRNEIGDLAAATRCSNCGDDKIRFRVVNNMTVKPTERVQIKAAQSPYTFSALKTENGHVVLSGWVESEEQRLRILTKANEAFSTVIDRTVDVALGAPNSDWEEVISNNLDKLILMKSGRFTLEDKASFISGEADTAKLRAEINEMVSELPAGYEGAANITVPNTAALNVGEIKSEAICQTLMNDLKSGKRINFAYDKASIRGAQSFDLLNALASATHQCLSFKVSVEGHTDADGAKDYNQRLSEARANSVVAYLSENGIDPDRMTVLGFGETKPIGDNSTDAGKAENRRIEFIVTQSE